jgi:hypothetical protein
MQNSYNDTLIKEKRKEIQKLFSSNKMFYDFTIDSKGIIEITVEDGDWKHDHLSLQHIMREAGYVFNGRHIPEDQDNGDDSFTAIYLYL